MDLELSAIIIDADLADLVDPEGIQETGPPFWDEMTMSHVESPFEVGGFDLVEEPVRFLDVVRDIMNFGQVRFFVVVLEINHLAQPVSLIGKSLDSVDRSLPAKLGVAEMIAAVTDDPAGPDGLNQLQVYCQSTTSDMMGTYSALLIAETG